jgi:ATP dependent DNA ligase domain
VIETPTPRPSNRLKLPPNFRDVTAAHVGTMVSVVGVNGYAPELDGQDLQREPMEVRKRQLATLLRRARSGLQLNEHIAESGDVVFRHACKLGFEGIVSKRLGSRYTSGRTRNWLKMKNADAPAVKREEEEDWGK